MIKVTFISRLSLILYQFWLKVLIGNICLRHLPYILLGTPVYLKTLTKTRPETEATMDVIGEEEEEGVDGKAYLVELLMALWKLADVHGNLLVPNTPGNKDREHEVYKVYFNRLI